MGQIGDDDRINYIALNNFYCYARQTLLLSGGDTIVTNGTG